MALRCSDSVEGDGTYDYRYERRIHNDTKNVQKSRLCGRLGAHGSMRSDRVDREHRYKLVLEESNLVSYDDSLVVFYEHWFIASTN